MADYYTKVSLAIALRSEEERQWWEQAIADKLALFAEQEEKEMDEDADEYVYPWGLETRVDADSVEIWGDEYPDIDQLTDLLAAFTLAFDVPPIGVEIAYDCSKARFDAYGGSALVIYKNRVASMHTSGWIAQEIKAITHHEEAWLRQRDLEQARIRAAQKLTKEQRAQLEELKRTRPVRCPKCGSLEVELTFTWIETRDANGPQTDSVPLYKMEQVKESFVPARCMICEWTGEEDDLLPFHLVYEKGEVE